MSGRRRSTAARNTIDRAGRLDRRLHIEALRHEAGNRDGGGARGIGAPPADGRRRLANRAAFASSSLAAAETTWMLMPSSWRSSSWTRERDKQFAPARAACLAEHELGDIVVARETHAARAIRSVPGTVRASPPRYSASRSAAAMRSRSSSLSRACGGRFDIERRPFRIELARQPAPRAHQPHRVGIGPRRRRRCARPPATGPSMACWRM